MHLQRFCLFFSKALVLFGERGATKNNIIVSHFTYPRLTLISFTLPWLTVPFWVGRKYVGTLAKWTFADIELERQSNSSKESSSGRKPPEQVKNNSFKLTLPFADYEKVPAGKENSIYWDFPYGSLPVFDNGTNRDIIATVGQTAYLHCRVLNIGDRAVSWIRKRDLHILTIGIMTYTNDQRFQSEHVEGSNDWTLKISSPQPRDNGIYECQVSTEPKISLAFRLAVVGRCFCCLITVHVLWFDFDYLTSILRLCWTLVKDFTPDLTLSALLKCNSSVQYFELDKHHHDYHPRYDSINCTALRCWSLVVIPHRLGLSLFMSISDGRWLN